ncbi:TrbG/VirB9 family P-type conjugative transfer protein [Halomonas sp. 3A7M]|uniref:TrbG/VirB9 family P-type conjugative transfer protein n=1 Tax=Halomonas sp. 3A7M TaxID=2742616 RepID=UPI00186785DC|nr:TrbG/VirB9 family P-type conjugative transfer protein [Halomonas sp. 3A7M]
MKYTIYRCLLAAGTCLVSLPAMAVDDGSVSPYDYRIRTVTYNELDTVRLDGVVGIATHIRVAPNEEYITHAFGEEGGWAFSNVENNYFVRPMAQDANTNLTIVTDRRVYHFLLNYIGSYTIEEDGQQVERFIENPWTMRAATVGVRFEYPLEDEEKQRQERERMRLDEALSQRDSNAPVNMRYRRSNAEDAQDIAPLNVWDDYTQTWFKFPQNSALPVVYRIDSNGEETLVNVTVEGPYNNVIRASGVAREWRVRYGDQVIGIINDGYNPSIGGHADGTTSPNVRRVINTGGEDE